MTFNRSLALYCARLIQAAYPGGALTPNVISAATDTQVWVGGGENFGAQNVRYVVFPGTASLRDAMTDVKIRKTPWSAGQVHRGFQAAFGSIAHEVTELLPANCEVIVTGHSLGGALATLFADALNGFRRVHSVWTFGSPRVGNGAYARAYNARLADQTFRITNAGDPVPWLPPLLLSKFIHWSTGFYTHVQREHYLNREGGLDVESLVAHLGEAREILTQPQAEIAHLTLATEHGLSSYVKKLEALA
jgi:hypothetical protein